MNTRDVISSSCIIQSGIFIADIDKKLFAFLYTLCYNHSDVLVKDDDKREAGMLDQGYYDRDKKKQPVGWRIFFIILTALIILVYAVVFLRFFQTCDSSQSKLVYLSEEAAQLYNADKDSLKVHKLSPQNPITGDGSFYMSFITYIESTNELQITVKYKDAVLRDPNNPDAFSYRLYDGNGTEFPLYYAAMDERQGYYYKRLCFSDLAFDFEEHTPIYLEITDSEGSKTANMTLFNERTASSRLKDYEVKEIGNQ